MVLVVRGANPEIGLIIVLVVLLLGGGGYYGMIAMDR